MRFELALAQISLKEGDKAHNMQKAERIIAKASEHGSSLILLPEAMDLGWTNPASLTESEPVPNGMPYRRIAKAAQDNNIIVCCGLTEKSPDGNVYNAAVLVDKDGTLLIHHRKINELEIARPYYAVGGNLHAVDTELGKIGLMICADAFVENEVISRTLGYMGAKLILSPCSWAVRSSHDNSYDPYGDFWRNVYIPVAKKFSLTIASVSNVGWLSEGPWAGKKCIGSSLVIGPDGEDIYQAPYGPEAEELSYITSETDR